MTQQIHRTTPVVGTAVPVPRRPSEPSSPSTLAPWTPTPPQGIRWLDATAVPPPSPSSRPPRTRRWVWVTAVAALVAAVALVAGLLVSANRTMTVQGTVVVAGSTALLPGAPCQAPALSDRSVSIFGADGLLVGTAPLSAAGVAVDQWGSSFPFADACRYTFLLSDVQASDDRYRVGVGSSVATTTEFTREQLETRGAAITYGR
ncbi:hypothetical protein [Actinomycetospora atypica]|uniref:Uncharacterized protein n=1 Tax=Actinomycetospora atypica TaxID=1290095 RepID=A0ABV9YJZ1_9PSEU